MGETPDSPQEKSPLPEEHVDERAREIAEGGEEGHEEKDEESARRSAEAILEESEERMFDNATVDPHDEGVIRRRSSETT